MYQTSLITQDYILLLWHHILNNFDDVFHKESNGINFGRSSYLGRWRGKLHLICFMTAVGTCHKWYFENFHPICWVKVCVSPIQYVNHWIQKIKVSFIHSAFFFFFHPILQVIHWLLIVLLLLCLYDIDKFSFQWQMACLVLVYVLMLLLLRYKISDVFWPYYTIIYYLLARGVFPLLNWRKMVKTMKWNK